MNIDLRTPHSPDSTKQAADLVAEGIRYLNYATLGDAPGLDYPADAYSLLGALYTATERLPQLLDQISAFLAGWEASGQLGDSNGADPGQRTTVAIVCLEDATVHARLADRALRNAQNAIAGLYVAEGKSGTEADLSGPSGVIRREGSGDDACPSCGSPDRDEAYYVPGGTGRPVTCVSDWHDDDAAGPGSHAVHGKGNTDD